jgi:hypothetical protein
MAERGIEVLDHHGTEVVATVKVDEDPDRETTSLQQSTLKVKLLIHLLDDN